MTIEDIQNYFESGDYCSELSFESIMSSFSNCLIEDKLMDEIENLYKNSISHEKQDSIDTIVLKN